MQNNKNITIKNTQKIDLETFKSYYYQMNAKPDTETKVFKEHKKVTLTKIRDLIERMNAKLENHTHFTIVGIDVIFTDKHSKSFSNYEAFNQYDWRTNKIVDSLSIKWDISITMPEYTLPQRHTVRLRFKSELKPSEYFELLTRSEDDLEAIEGKAFLVCKVDFINVVLSTELINVVESWYNCLASIEEKGTILNFTEKNRRLFPYSTEIAVIITMISFSYYIFKYINPFGVNLTDTNINIFELFTVVAFLFVVYYIGKRIGQFFGGRIYEIINNLEGPLVFEITDGDKNEEINNKKRNTTLLKRIYSWAILAILASIISVLTEKLLNSFLG